ncbi:MAG: hypothetical protein GY772_16690, partial [bacterium]|nr:hypothetical protein [bacterium]
MEVEELPLPPPEENTVKKRAVTWTATPPPHFERVATLSDGNCLFDARSQGLERPGKQKPMRAVRLAVVKHLRQHSQNYEAPFDGASPTSTGEPTTWENYLTQLSRSKTWGSSMEVAAAAVHWNVHILVMAPNLPPQSFNKAGEGMIVLWFEARHYDLLVGTPADAVLTAAVKGTPVGNRGGALSTGSSEDDLWRACCRWCSTCERPLSRHAFYCQGDLWRCTGRFCHRCAARHDCALAQPYDVDNTPIVHWLHPPRPCSACLCAPAWGDCGTCRREICHRCSSLRDLRCSWCRHRVFCPLWRASLNWTLPRVMGLIRAWGPSSHLVRMTLAEWCTQGLERHRREYNRIVFDRLPSAHILSLCWPTLPVPLHVRYEYSLQVRALLTEWRDKFRQRGPARRARPWICDLTHAGDVERQPGPPPLRDCDDIPDAEEQTLVILEQPWAFLQVQGHFGPETIHVPTAGDMLSSLRRLEEAIGMQSGAVRWSICVGSQYVPALGGPRYLSAWLNPYSGFRLRLQWQPLDVTNIWSPRPPACPSLLLGPVPPWQHDQFYMDARSCWRLRQVTYRICLRMGPDYAGTATRAWVRLRRTVVRMDAESRTAWQLSAHIATFTGDTRPLMSRLLWNRLMHSLHGNGILFLSADMIREAWTR